MADVEWEYEEKNAVIGASKIRITRNGNEWFYTVTHEKTGQVTGSTKLVSWAEEKSINAAKWLNAGMPAI